MKYIVATIVAVFLCFGVEVCAAQDQETTAFELLSAESQQALMVQYCLWCHDDVERSGDLSMSQLDLIDLTSADENAKIVEKIIRKLRAGMMPPPGQPRPDPTTLKAFVESLEQNIDKASAANPNPGRRALSRLNRIEYANSIRDLLGIEVDVAALLPPDSMGHGFDNMADALNISPALIEGYMRAANEISRVAVGDAKASATSQTYSISRTVSQMYQVEGAPMGTRGGISVVHNFPADGEYTFKMTFYGESTGGIFGLNNPMAEDFKEEIEVSINGERAEIIEVVNSMNESQPAGLSLTTKPIAVRAGPQRVSAVFIQRFFGLVDDVVRPIEHTIADQQVSTGEGITTLPHLQDVTIKGPFNPTGVSFTPSRAKIFTCRPTTLVEEQPCAEKIISDLAIQAYRRPISAEDLEGVIGFYRRERESSDFEAGIRTALQAILASPSFVFRFESVPAGTEPGQNHQISGLALASRLSYFLWSTVPDEELLRVAGEGQLQDPLILRRQVKRMLGDVRSGALSTRFAGQWLRLRDLEGKVPDPIFFPQFDSGLGHSMRRETELLFDNIVREDRDILDLLTSDYTFVDERLAKHYKLPNVIGNRFRRVRFADENRKGLLGHASILTLTSNPDRTSPVQRGKYVMEVLLGSPPPAPPPNVPALEETERLTGEKVLSLRLRMEEHRDNPICASCHKLIDPIGLALENFDVTGRWRTLDAGTPIDPTGELYDGTILIGPSSLRQAILDRSDAFLHNFTENLLTFALGRKVEHYDMPTVRSIAREAKVKGNRFSFFIMGVVESEAFRMSRSERNTMAEEAEGRN